MTVFLAGVFDSEKLRMLGEGCANGLSGAGWVAGLAATWAAGLAALLGGGLAPGLAALGGGLAGGLAGGSSPCGKQFASGTSHMKYNFPLAKTFASPHTPRAFVAYTSSVSDALSRFLAEAKHIFLVMMSRLCLHATIHAQGFRSISWCLVFLPNP